MPPWGYYTNSSLVGIHRGPSPHSNNKADLFHTFYCGKLWCGAQPLCSRWVMLLISCVKLYKPTCLENTLRYWSSGLPYWFVLRNPFFCRRSCPLIKWLCTDRQMFLTVLLLRNVPWGWTQSPVFGYSVSTECCSPISCSNNSLLYTINHRSVTLNVKQSQDDKVKAQAVTRWKPGIVAWITPCNIIIPEQLNMHFDLCNFIEIQAAL